MTILEYPTDFLSQQHIGFSGFCSSGLNVNHPYGHGLYVMDDDLWAEWNGPGNYLPAE